MCKAYGGEPSVDLLRSFLNLGHAGDWLTLSCRGRCSKKSVSNEAPVINAEPISVAHPLNITENIMNSHNLSSDEGGLSLIDPNAPSYLEEGKRSMVARKRKLAGKRKVDVGSHGEEFPSAKELKDVTNCHWVVAHVTYPSWKQYLGEISIEQLYDIHDKAYMRQAVLDNVLTGRTRELISALHKAMASYDTMREREIKKDKAVTSMASTMSKVGSYLKTIRGLSKSRLYPPFVLKSKASDLKGKDSRLLKSSFYKRCTVFKEVAELKKPFVLVEMPGYRPSLKEEYDEAGNDLVDASYPFLPELTTDPHASVEQLLSKKPQSLQSKLSIVDLIISSTVANSVCMYCEAHVWPHDLCKLVITEVRSSITDNGSGIPNLAKRFFKNLQTTRASFVGSAFASTHFDKQSTATTPQIAYAQMDQQSSEYSPSEAGLVVPVFQKGDDPIDAINHMMSFLTSVVASHFPATNNQLRTSSNPRQQATINNGRVTIQPIQGRQNYVSAGSSRPFTSGKGGAQGKQRVITCYNCKGEGADNRPPMLEKDMYDLWKSRIKLYMLNRPNGRMILKSVEQGPLLWPTVEVE
nr:hypothetical protein [Tanacetum cinerariifolium]